MNSPLRPRRIALSATAAAVLAVTASGCGAIVERASEAAIERAVESENGGDVEIDFDSGDGTFRVESSEGDITFSADDDGISIDGTDANGDDFSLDADEGGIQGESDAGGSIDIDQDGDGTITATGDDGEVTEFDIDTDGENGRVVVQSDDGESVFRSGQGIPEQWPGGVPRPDGLTDVNSSYAADSATVFIVVAGQSSGGVDEFADAYISDLEAAGFVEESNYSDQSSRSGTFTRGGENVALNVSSLGGGTDVALTYALSG